MEPASGSKERLSATYGLSDSPRWDLQHNDFYNDSIVLRALRDLRSIEQDPTASHARRGGAGQKLPPLQAEVERRKIEVADSVRKEKILFLAERDIDRILEEDEKRDRHDALRTEHQRALEKVHQCIMEKRQQNVSIAKQRSEIHDAVLWVREAELRELQRRRKEASESAKAESELRKQELRLERAEELRKRNAYAKIQSQIAADEKEQRRLAVLCQVAENRHERDSRRATAEEAKAAREERLTAYAADRMQSKIRDAFLKLQKEESDMQQKGQEGQRLRYGQRKAVQLSYAEGQRRRAQDVRWERELLAGRRLIMQLELEQQHQELRKKVHHPKAATAPLPDEVVVHPYWTRWLESPPT
jgi:hypothetical protein